MKTCRESTGIPPLILNLGTRWRLSGYLHALPILPQERTVIHAAYKAGYEPEVVRTFRITEKFIALVMPPKMVLWPNCTCLVKTL